MLSPFRRHTQRRDIKHGYLQALRNLRAFFNSLIPFYFQFPKLLERGFKKSLILSQVLISQVVQMNGVIGFFMGDIIVKYSGIDVTWSNEVFNLVNFSFVAGVAMFTVVFMAGAYWKLFGWWYRINRNVVFHHFLLFVQNFAAIVATGNKRKTDGGPGRMLLVCLAVSVMYPSCNFWIMIPMFGYTILWSLISDFFIFRIPAANALRFFLDTSITLSFYFVVGFVVRLVFRRSYLLKATLEFEKNNILAEKKKRKVLIQALVPKFILEKYYSSTKSSQGSWLMEKIPDVYIVFVEFRSLCGVATAEQSPCEQFRRLNRAFLCIPDDGVGVIQRVKFISNRCLLCSNMNKKPSVQDVVEACGKIVHKVREINLDVVIGLARGMVFSGVMGESGFLQKWDIFGYAVNFSSRMADTASVNTVHMERSILDCVKLENSNWTINERVVNIKGKGIVETYEVCPFVSSSSTAEEADSLELANGMTELPKTFNTPLPSPLRRAKSCASNVLESPRKETQESNAFIERNTSRVTAAEIPLSREIMESERSLSRCERELNSKFQGVLAFTSCFKSRHLNDMYDQQSRKEFAFTNRILFTLIGVVCVLSCYQDFLLIAQGLVDMSYGKATVYRFLIAVPVHLFVIVLVWSPLYNLKNAFFGKVLFSFITVMGLVTMLSTTLFLLVLKIRHVVSESIDWGSSSTSAKVTLSFELQNLLMCIVVFGGISFNYKLLLVSTGTGCIILLFMISEGSGAWHGMINLYIMASFCLWCGYRQSSFEKWNFRMSLLSKINQNTIQKEKTKMEQLVYVYFPKVIYDVIFMDMEKSQLRTVASSLKFVQLLTDWVGFTRLSNELSPDELVEWLSRVYKMFHTLEDSYQLVHVLNQLGDCFHVVSGIIGENNAVANAVQMIDYAHAVISQMKKLKRVEFRFGMHIGNVTAGCLLGPHESESNQYRKWISFHVLSSKGTKITSNLEQTGDPMRIHISEELNVLVKDVVETEKRQGTIIHPFKNNRVQTYYVQGKLKEKLRGVYFSKIIASSQTVSRRFGLL